MFRKCTNILATQYGHLSTANHSLEQFEYNRIMRLVAQTGSPLDEEPVSLYLIFASLIRGHDNNNHGAHKETPFVHTCWKRLGVCMKRGGGLMSGPCHYFLETLEIALCTNTHKHTHYLSILLILYPLCIFLIDAKVQFVSKVRRDKLWNSIINIMSCTFKGKKKVNSCRCPTSTSRQDESDTTNGRHPEHIPIDTQNNSISLKQAVKPLTH